MIVFIPSSRKPFSQQMPEKNVFWIFFDINWHVQLMFIGTEIGRSHEEVDKLFIFHIVIVRIIIKILLISLFELGQQSLFRFLDDRFGGLFIFLFVFFSCFANVYLIIFIVVQISTNIKMRMILKIFQPHCIFFLQIAISPR
ncbi:hypothetical protein ACHAXS_001934 [Conticribra weissflogii]